MIRQRQNRRSCTLLSILLSLALLFGVLPARAFAVTQAEIDELQRRKEEIEEKVAEKQAVVDDLEEQQASVLEKKQALDERNDYLYEQLRINDEQIALYDEMIEQKSLEVDEAKRLEDEQLERYRKRVRAMEENGKADFLSMLLNANSLGEFLTAIDDIGEIMESDKLLEDAYIAARENHEHIKADYEEYKAGLEEKKAGLEDEQQQIETQIDEAKELLEKILEDLDLNSEELEELLKAQEEAEELIDQKIAELEEQKRLAAEAAAAAAAAAGGGDGGEGGGVNYGTVTGTGSFAWPCGCTYITSVVGYRYHPISGVYKYHSGMDIGCQYGDGVFASDSGTVIIAGVNGGYGNCVMIDHNNGYYTLYGHLSSVGVSVGQAVSQGEYIGAVGSTGVSTGPHLHFEIRNGSGAIDFNGWFGGLSYAPDSGG